MKTNQISKIRSCIAHDDIANAIKLLSIIAKDERLDEVVLQSARKYRIEKEILEGVISYENASITRNQITKALLGICREIDEHNIKLSLNVDLKEGYFLHQFPTGPMIEGYLIDDKLIEGYARLIPHRQAMGYINKANRLRKEADPDDKYVTILEPYSLLSPLE